MKSDIRFVSVLALLFIPTVGADAATLTYTLQNTSTGTFSLFAEVSTGDNFGLASYGVELSGSITSLDHLSPNTSFAQNGSALSGPAGFTFLRSDDGDLVVEASQDTSTPTPHIIYGFGQTASSFIDEGLNALAPAEQPSWDIPLLVATGTYDGLFDSIRFSEQSAGNFGHAFASSSNLTTEATELQFRYVDATVVPEPSTLVMFCWILVARCCLPAVNSDTK